MHHKMSTQVSTAYDYILNRILTYDLKPEAIVSDNQLAKELGISRAPVREAILILVMDGLVQTSNDGKMIVSPISFNDISDIFHVRSALESEAIRMIAEQGWLMEEQYNQLVVIHEKLSQTNVNKAFSEHYFYDDQFHSTLISYSGSSRIPEISAQLRLQMQRIRWLSLLSADRQTNAVAEHASILQAIKEKNCEKTIQCLHQHFQESEYSYKNIFKSETTRHIALAVSAMINSDGNLN